MTDVVFWQRIVSPHMGYLAQELAKRGLSVTYVAAKNMSSEREAMGWIAPDISPANQIIAESEEAMLKMLSGFPMDAVHICQGLRSNGPIRKVQRALAQGGMRHWAILETIDDDGWRGAIKRVEYSRLCRQFGMRGEGILAIGNKTASWLRMRGLSQDQIVQFAYFLHQPSEFNIDNTIGSRPVRIVYAGQLIARKRVQDLLEAVNGMKQLEVWIVGDGPEKELLRQQAEVCLPTGVKWFGTVPQKEVTRLVAQADCLVLPSRHDGWGAVASEALMVGTPAICSDRCGVAGVVEASGIGGVYPAGNVHALKSLLERVLKGGPLSLQRRTEVRSWARSLNAESGAAYLHEILQANTEKTPFPVAPWQNRSRSNDNQ
jgi:glycosyltransferase involved in cell wall biosynthesis